MSDPQQDLRSTSASIHRDAEHLAKLEEAKLALDPADPRIVELSEQAERIATEIGDKVAAQRELSDEVQRPG